MKIGIIGAENSHTAKIAQTINVDKKFKGFTVDYVWGETDEFAKVAAKAGKIPNIVKNQKDMLGKIDALVVAHRHGKYHLKAALPFVKQGIPTFIDKPFCYRSAEGKEFIKIAKKHKTPITSFGIVPHQNTFRRFVKDMAEKGDNLAGVTYGPSDLKSPWGGVFFYGIHQVEMALLAFGYNVSSVLLTKNRNGSTGQLLYSDGRIVTMNLIKEGCPGFAISAVGNKGTLHKAIAFDKNAFLNGITMFTKMFKTGEEPFKYGDILKSVLVLEALEKSVKSGKIEKVGK
ncbi:MAG: Gfo/Idh/MocA family oxidoreductase [Phycisphaerae bacterium]|nr:Gfo/Idh/MocA family oxidoreductase [Phycisphaerae bacterium]